MHQLNNGSTVLSSNHSGKLIQEETFLGTGSREWLARGRASQTARQGNKNIISFLFYLVYVLVLGYIS